ncbi:MAG: hypothetical protein QN183_12350 [Armatimonadota bacterium]|nr:hypothetical protein [Armatimonadota bacterium]MDR7485266.1 hypothetical protein [Armatimonadota bacterium]MDR7533896.1 hypothetical protein [Armatimonadota bacterium]MDR7537142.1 hypothetical protein [Armatimonadota bacterium]
MRTVTAVVILVLLVAGVAIRGSMARPIAEPGAVLQCHAAGRGSVECRPLQGPLSVMMEEGPGFDVGGDYGALAGVDAAEAGAGYGEPDRLSARQAFDLVTLLVEFATRAFDWATNAGLIGGSMPTPLPVAERLFDPQ